MAHPRIILLGSVKEAAKWIGLARKWANQVEKAGIPRKVWNLGKATVTVDNYGSGILRAVIRAVAGVAPPTPPDETRYFDLNCDTYGDAYTYGDAETVDVWDLSAIPDGISLDFYYSADQPTQFVVVYAGATVLDTGSVTGTNNIEGILTSGAESTFSITTYQPDPVPDSWAYSLYLDCGGGGGV